MLNEQLSSRLEARLKFLELEQKQLRSYNNDLVYFLLVSKKLLEALLNVKLNTRNAHSVDVSESSPVRFKDIEAEFAKTQQLFSDLQSARRLRDMAQGRLLISKQLTQEAKRKETQAEKESEESISEITFSLNKKNIRIKQIQEEVVKLQTESNSRKNDRITVLTLDTKNLAYHKHMTKLKDEIAKASKQLQLCVLQTEELETYSCGLMDSIDKYKILARNPGLKFRRSLNMSYHDSDESESSVECVFPDKFQVGSLSKPELPRLDFSKLPKKNNVDKAKKNVQVIKSLIQEAENRCKEKTETIQKTREMIAEVEGKNEKLVDIFEGIQYGIKTERRRIDIQNEREKDSKRRTLSNVLDYIYREVILHKNQENRKQSSLEDGASRESSFSSVIVKEGYDDEEPDSVFYECIKNI